MKYHVYRFRCFWQLIIPMLLLAFTLRAQTVFYRINAGGPQIGSFAAEQNYAYPSYYSGGGTAYSTQAIAGADSSLQSLYQSDRFGDFSYAFPVTNGYYRVVLHFADFQATGPRQRVFDVEAEGVQVLTNYDIYKKVGAMNTATTETFQIKVTDGTLDLLFVPHPNCSWPKVSAIEVLSPLPLPTPPAGVDTAHIATWGDSYTDRNYGRYPASLGKLTGLTVYNGGVGGETSTQIKDRMLLPENSDKLNWPTIIWAGRNNSSSPATVVQDISTMIAHLTHTNYLVVSVCNARYEPQGSWGYNTQLQLDASLASTFGNHYVNLRSFWVDHYDGSVAQDQADAVNDAPPSTHIDPADALHPSVGASDLFATYFYRHLSQLMSSSGLRTTLATTTASTANASLVAYPNPVTSSTTLAFVLPETQVYSLDLYDAQGNLVKHLAAGTAQAATRYAYSLASPALRQGIYLARLNAGKFSKLYRLTVEL